jgi:hypothetical protein
MASFSIVNDDNLKYKLTFVPIFAITDLGTNPTGVGWSNNVIANTNLKKNAFRTSLIQTVLFTGSLSFYKETNVIPPSQIEIKIRFNSVGSTNYIYESLKFPIINSTEYQEYNLPINFVKTFTQPDSYDVYIYFEGNFRTFQRDYLYLNAILYDSIIPEDNFEL